MYNILTDAYLLNTTSGTGYTFQPLVYADLTGLASNSTVIAVSGGSYLGIEAQFGVDLVCSEARIYTPEVSSGIVKLHYKEFLGNQWRSDGAYNYNTDYATPKMITNVDPDPYACSASTEWSTTTYAARKAFTQTNNDTTDCWLSLSAPPQSLMFYFPYPKIVNKFALQSRNDSNSSNRYFPKNFVFQGNSVTSPSVTNDTHWETLLTVSGVTDPGQGSWSTYFTFENAQAYSYYRLKVTSSNSDGTKVAVAELKMVEANRPESVPVSLWHEHSLTWNGTYYSYSFPSSIGIEAARFFLGSTTGISVSGVNLFTPDTFMTISGVVASGIYCESYSFSPLTTSPLLLNLRNLSSYDSLPKVSLSYTGVYDLDRNLFISTDYPINYYKESSHWFGLDYGYTVPEIEPFTRGIFINTKVESRQVLLNDTSTSGSWRSPVIDTEGDFMSAYVYTLGNVTLYARASDNPPPLVNFMVTTTDPSHRWLVYNHKHVYFDSSGTVIGENVCGSSGNKIWRSASYDWAGTQLMYYGSINELGTAALFVPGYTSCGDMTPEQEFGNYKYWYNLCLCKVDDSSQWEAGPTVSGLAYDTSDYVVFTKTFPVPDSDGFFCFSIVSNEVELSTSVSMSFIENGKTLGSFPIIRESGPATPGIGLDVAYDQANNGWWVYLGFNLYKVDPGSINNVRIFKGSDGQGNMLPDDMKGYIWKVALDQSLKRLIAIPANVNYFWGFSGTEIYLYEEVYEGGEVYIDVKATITQGVQVSTSFEELHVGSCDSFGNLWVLDLEQERIMRVSFSKALAGDPSAIDYENQVTGTVHLWAHPTDSTCYLLVSDEPEHPEQDIIRKVHANQRWGSQSQYICAVPGFYSKPYVYGIDFTGKSFSGGIRPHVSDPIWGMNSSLEWLEYKSDGRLLPRGRYKQLRVDLGRDTTDLSSPRVQRLRLPKPILMEPVGRNHERQVALKSTLNRAKTPGNWNTKLRVWWIDKEI